ncbi:MAG: methyltransferase [Myxococcales bacterium]|nr:methyltransferase [Myxococcales bacterium]
MSQEIEYPSSAIAHTHPARLAARAIERGLLRDFCHDFRYLELACGDASNLLALASRFPEATFVGVDVDSAAIARGLDRAKRLGLQNLSLLARDLREVEPSGPFDYVVAHGVYSWVARDVQRALLESSKRLLADRGVFYVSYNTMPGWGLRGVLRAVMRDAAATETEPRARLRRAKLAVARLQQYIPKENPYGALLGAELAMVQNKHDGYLLGEHLAPHNEALFVTEFLERVEAAGFQFLAEQIPATPDGALEQTLPAELEALGLSPAEAQRQLDVLCYRQFRATLLCHGERSLGVASAEQLRDRGYLAGQLQVLAQEPLLAPGAKLAFETPSGVVVESDQPLQKAALLVLARSWPTGLRVAELMSAALGELKARALLDGTPVSPKLIEDAIGDLLELVSRRQLELLPWSPSSADSVPTRPALPELTRLEAARGHVTTPRHEPLTLDALRTALLPLLDGHRDLLQLAAELRALREAGELVLDPDQARVLADDGALHQLIQQVVREALRFGLFPASPVVTPGPGRASGTLN